MRAPDELDAGQGGHGAMSVSKVPITNLIANTPHYAWPKGLEQLQRVTKGPRHRPPKHKRRKR